MSLVPQNRLLLLVGAIVVPLAVAGALVPGAGTLALLACAGLFLFAVGDAAGALGRGAELRAEFPPVVRLAKDRAGEIAFLLVNERPGNPGRELRLALPLPAEFDAADELPATLPANESRSAFVWEVTARRRGRFPLDRLFWEEASPLGLWARRGSFPVTGGEVRVYPDLLRERRQAAAVFLKRGGIGGHAQRQVGRGREFEKLRDYVSGDAVEDISWKATARRRRLVSKVFRVERTQEVYVILDHSRLSARPAPRPDDPNGAVITSLERCVTSALLLMLAAERQGDLFGLATFSDRVGSFLRAGSGPAHFDRCREAIHALEPALVSPDFEETCAFLRARLRRRALLVFLTALDDPLLGDLFTQQIEILSRQHLVLVNTLRPPGVSPLFAEPDDAPAVAGTADVYARLAGHLQWQKLRERENVLRQRGVRFALVDRERLTAQLIGQYVNVKQRQIL